MVIYRRLPQNLIARRKAIFKIKLTVPAAITAGTITLPAAIAANIMPAHSSFETKYQDVIEKEAIVLELIKDKNKQSLYLKTFTLDFLKVLKFSINRSVMLDDGNYAETDINFYNLDELGGNLPELRTDDERLTWASDVVEGEASRLAAKPTAPAMSNPSAADISTYVTPLETLITDIATANTALTLSRQDINGNLVDIDNFIQSVWDFLDANFTNLPDAAKRNVLRSYGVVYISMGPPNTLSFLVKNTTGEPLEGATATIEQTGATATANNEGRINLQTTVLGPISIVVSFPGKESQTIEYTIPDDAEEQTYTLPEVVLEDNV